VKRIKASGRTLPEVMTVDAGMLRRLVEKSLE
jgi:hypothetical protein